MADKLKQTLSSGFRLNGLIIKAEDLALLTNAFSNVSQANIPATLDRVIECVLKQDLDSSILSKDIIVSAIKDCSVDSNEKDPEVFNVIDSFSVPLYRYDLNRKQFILRIDPANLFGDSLDKVDAVAMVYDVIHQRVSRHEMFNPSGLHDQAPLALKPIEYLLGTASDPQKRIMILGMLTKNSKGGISLEDPTGILELNLASASFGKGLFTEGCFVLAEGELSDGVMKASSIDMPPVESNDHTRSYFGNVNFFGGPAKHSVKSSQKLMYMEKDFPEAMFVILSDVWLDNDVVLDKLQSLFAGFADTPPLGFVFCGPFCKESFGPQHTGNLIRGFNRLHDILLDYPGLTSSSRMIFVPSSLDPVLGSVLPRPPIPAALVSKFISKYPNCSFTTNPARIQYCTKEIVVFRENLVSKMIRNTLKLPGEEADHGTDLVKHMTHTLLTQSHLSTLPPLVSPTYWGYHHSLSLYPAPDLVIIADKFDGYDVVDSGTRFANPGSFSNAGFVFKVYYPASNIIEDSQVP